MTNKVKKLKLKIKYLKESFTFKKERFWDQENFLPHGFDSDLFQKYCNCYNYNFIYSLQRIILEFQLAIIRLL